MPLYTTLFQVPNQSFSTVLEEDAYNIRVITFNNITYISAHRNGEQIIRNQKAMINRNVLLYQYQYNEYGNFRFASEIDDYPYYLNFGVSVFFVYLTKSEVENGL